MTIQDILQTQLNTLQSDAQTLSDNIKQRQDAIQRLTIEIEQHRGAHAYNLQLTETVKKSLAELAASSPTL